MRSSESRIEYREPPKEVLTRIITDDEGACDMVKWAEIVGGGLASQLTTNQIRSLFGEVRMIEGMWQAKNPGWHRRLILLKPKMAYRAKKESGRGVRELVDVLSPAIDYVQGKEDNFRRFVEFFEAILAYHKAHGGR